MHLIRSSMTIARYALLAAALGVLAAGPAAAEPACNMLPRGIAGWWPGEGTAADITLAADHGTPFGGVAFAPGVIGQAFQLDGVNDRIDVPDAAVLRPTRFTLAAWVRLDAPNEWACIICKQVGSGDANSYTLWVNNGVLQGGMFRYAEAVGPALPVGEVQHVAVTYDGSIIRLYRNGDLDLDGARTGRRGPLRYESGDHRSRRQRRQRLCRLLQGDDRRADDLRQGADEL